MADLVASEVNETRHPAEAIQSAAIRTLESASKIDHFSV
jgi:hypothetical protein